MNTEDKILKQLEELNKKQQLTNELLLAQYHILQEHIFRQNSPVCLLSEEVDDYFTENILKDSTNKKLDEEIGGLFKDLPVCSQCGYRRFMFHTSWRREELHGLVDIVEQIQQLKKILKNTLTGVNNEEKRLQGNE